MDHFSVANGKAYPPSRHVIAFGKREEFDADFLGAGDLKEARRLVAVEGDVRIGQIVDDQEIMFLREANNALKEFQFHNLCRRVMGKADDQELRLGPCLLDRMGMLRRSPPARTTEY